MRSDYPHVEPVARIRAEYFQWLCGLVGIDEPDHSFWILAKTLHRKEFFWTVPNDDNRAKDGEELRRIFIDECGYSTEDVLDAVYGPCSMLELLIGIALRMESTLSDGDYDRTKNWFWELIENTGLDKFTDTAYLDSGGTFAVDDVLNRILERTYHKNGDGGLFPLKKAKNDQRKVEIWYQMSAYLLENYNIIE